MSKKKQRAFFVCPQWDQIAAGTAGSAETGWTHGARKAMAAISAGTPVARSTLRKALLAVQQDSGRMFDVDAYIVDRRTMPQR